MQLTIDRNHWHRGGHNHPRNHKTNSTLLCHIDGTWLSCCLGIYAKACGVPDAMLLHHTTPAAVVNDRHMQHTLDIREILSKFVKPTYPEAKEEAEDTTFINSQVGEAMMSINDANDESSDWIFVKPKTIESIVGLKEYLTGQNLLNPSDPAGLTIRIMKFTEEQREAMIAICFKHIGVDVTYVN